jgi:hypothetical protein
MDHTRLAVPVQKEVEQIEWRFGGATDFMVDPKEGIGVTSIRRYFGFS